MLTFVRYAIGVTVRPRATFRTLLADSARVRVGFGGLLALAAAYAAGISIGLARHPGWTPDRPVLRIPPRRYYFWERLFILPVAVGETVLTAGVARLLARARGGHGRFEDLFALFGLAHATLVPSMAVPDAAGALLRPRRATRHLYYAPAVYGGTLWMLALLVLAIHEAEGLSWAESAAVTLPAAMANAAVEYVFIR